jgi:hypothetical protein
MIFSAQPGWALLYSSVRVSDDESAPLAVFHDLPIVAWRTERTRLIPMVAGEEPRGLRAILCPDGQSHR